MTVNTAFAPGSNPITFGAWAKRSTSSFGATSVVIAKGIATSGNLCWTLQYTSAGLVQASVSGDGSTTFSATSTASFVDLNWRHVVAVYQNPSLTVYVDGVLVPVTTSGTAPTTPLYNTTSMPVGVGVAVTSLTPTFAARWTGSVTEAFVTVQALSADQISAILHRGAWAALNGSGVARQSGRSAKVPARWAPI